ncbi:hypothetical protein CR970_03555 [Candidatus Saccharibacteria bacterium]|nr:MAG: hypothetical protein CR970_03555 [Candidatus Saccharibacteria bacterium]
MGHSRKQKYVSWGVGRGSVPLHSKHRHPYRKKHFAALAAVGLVVAGLCVQVGMITGTAVDTGVVAGVSTSAPPQHVVQSPYGYALHIDPQRYDVVDEPQHAQTIIRGLEGARGPQAAARLRIMSGGYRVQEQDVSLHPVAQRVDDVAGRRAERVTYRVSHALLSVPSYAVAWRMQSPGVDITIAAEGLLSPAVPEPLMKALEGLRLPATAEGQVAGERTDGRTAMLSDMVSPSVVRIYHIVCGQLYLGQTLVGGDQLCDASTGSGFFVNDSGHIATNGHVVVSDARDIFADMLSTNPVLLADFLNANGIRSGAIDDTLAAPNLLASAVALVYDAPDELVRMENMRQAIFVALGSEPLLLPRDADLSAVLDLQDTEQLKRAQLEGYDYSAQDMVRIALDDERGFVSSDVALLKIDATNTPALPLSVRQAPQGADVTLVGFPTDAENDLVSAKVIAPSVTRGTINSVRLAAGANGTLYQSDADASRGSSGGPAVLNDGRVFGLLTYRFASDEPADAAKSYIRDIADLIALAKRNDVPISPAGSTQQLWRSGLAAYGGQHYKDALAVFRQVKQQYPAHRLANGYIESSTAAIGAGKDVPRYAVAVYYGSLAVCAAIFVAILVMIGRHYTRHRLWRSHTLGRAVLRVVH